MRIGINETAANIHEWAQSKGWWESPRPTGELLMLVVTEISEAMEDYRMRRMETVISEDGKPEGFPSEIADAVIRLLDLSEAYGIDLEAEIARKMAYNQTRPYRHGNKAA